LYTPGMGLFHRLFGGGQVTLEDVVRRVKQLESALRTLETEQVTMHDQVRKWMRRAIAAERRIESVAEVTDAPGRHGASPPPRRLNWRDRIEARRAAARATSTVAPGTTNGGGG